MFNNITLLIVLSLTIKDAHSDIPSFEVINESFVNVQLKENYISEDLGSLDRIVLIQQESNESKVLAVTSREYEKALPVVDNYDSNDVTIYQPIDRPEGILVKMNPCTPLKSLYIRLLLKDKTRIRDLPSFDYFPVNYIENDINSWICKEDLRTIWVHRNRSENYQVSNCVKNIFMLQKNGAEKKELEEGWNTVEEIAASGSVTVVITLPDGSYARELDLIPCTVSKVSKVADENGIIWNLGLPPKVIPINDTFVYVDYKSLLNTADFEQIHQIEIFQELPSGSDLQKRLSLAVKNVGNIFIKENEVIQPLIEGQPLLANINPCDSSKNLHMRINFDIETSFIYNITKLIIEDLDKWICAVEKKYIIINRRNSHLLNLCFKNISLMVSGNDIPTKTQELFDGVNNITGIDLDGDSKLDLMINNDKHTDIKFEQCFNQGNYIYPPVDTWICVQENNSIVNIKKTNWEYFTLEEIHYDDTLLKNGSNYIDVPNSLKIELFLTVRFKEVENPVSNYYILQLTHCPSSVQNHHEDSGRMLPIETPLVNDISMNHGKSKTEKISILVGIPAALTATLILSVSLFIYLKTRKPDVNEGVDTNPEYGMNQYSDYYTQSEICDDNDMYNDYCEE